MKWMLEWKAFSRTNPGSRALCWEWNLMYIKTISQTLNQLFNIIKRISTSISMSSTWNVNRIKRKIFTNLRKLFLQVRELVMKRDSREIFPPLDDVTWNAICNQTGMLIETENNRIGSISIFNHHQSKVKHRKICHSLFLKPTRDSATWAHFVSQLIKLL